MEARRDQTVAYTLELTPDSLRLKPGDRGTINGIPATVLECGPVPDPEPDVQVVLTTPAFLVCFECGHVFPSAEVLLAEHNAQGQRMVEAEENASDGMDFGFPFVPKTSADQVTFCPRCSHDF